MRGPNQVDSETGSAKRATREHQQCFMTSPIFGDQPSQEKKKRNSAELHNEKNGIQRNWKTKNGIQRSGKTKNGIQLKRKTNQLIRSNEKNGIS